MNNNPSSSSSGIGFWGLLTIAFIALKLAGFIDWPWLWVLAPIWCIVALASIVIIFVFIKLFKP